MNECMYCEDPQGDMVSTHVCRKCYNIRQNKRQRQQRRDKRLKPEIKKGWLSVPLVSRN